MCRTAPVAPAVRAAHGQLHARCFAHYLLNTHPYYHREGVWLDRLARR